MVVWEENHVEQMNTSSFFICVFLWVFGGVCVVVCYRGTLTYTTGSVTIRAGWYEEEEKDDNLFCALYYKYENLLK